MDFITRFWLRNALNLAETVDNLFTVFATDSPLQEVTTDPS